MKKYYILKQIGKSRYVLNFHDGIKKHPDGSDFYDIEIFKSKKKMTPFIIELHNQGYVSE